MVKHIVLWKLSEFAEGNSKEINKTLIKEKLLGLKQKIQQIDSLEVGFNYNTTDAAYDVVLITTHESPAALSEYAAHPDHKEVAAFIGKVVSGRKVVDFEY